VARIDQQVARARAAGEREGRGWAASDGAGRVGGAEVEHRLTRVADEPQARRGVAGHEAQDIGEGAEEAERDDHLVGGVDREGR
jgi:hypothetical protein